MSCMYASIRQPPLLVHLGRMIACLGTYLTLSATAFAENGYDPAKRSGIPILLGEVFGGFMLADHTEDSVRHMYCVPHTVGIACGGWLCEYSILYICVTPMAQKDQTDPSVGRSRHEGAERGTSDHAAAH